jgi:DNA-binding transcriptional regulator YbjK
VPSSTDPTTVRIDSPRRQRIARAALSVLAAEGARGLTHRAVDSAAGLAEGSTSNCFRTRAALLAAALAMHVELDLGPAGEVIVGPLEPLERTRARALILAGLWHVLGDRTLLLARYELVLEASRRQALHAELSEARARFVSLAEAVLEASGCESPRAHAIQLVACLDGILMDQLIDADAALDREAIEQLLDRLLDSC